MFTLTSFNRKDTRKKKNTWWSWYLLGKNALYVKNLNQTKKKTVNRVIWVYECMKTHATSPVHVPYFISSFIVFWSLSVKSYYRYSFNGLHLDFGDGLLDVLNVGWVNGRGLWNLKNDNRNQYITVCWREGTKSPHETNYYSLVIKWSVKLRKLIKYKVSNVMT